MSLKDLLQLCRAAAALLEDRCSKDGKAFIRDKTRGFDVIFNHWLRNRYNSFNDFNGEESN